VTGSADLVHGICGFGIDGGTLVPSLGEGIPEASVMEGRRLELHVFSSAVEAAAFSAGVTRAARNGLHAVVGRNGAERVVALDVSEPDRPAPQHFADSVDPVDHGGLALQTASAGWWSLRTSLPDGLALDISSDGATVELDAGTRRFTLSNEWGDVVASTTYRASDRRVSTALMCNWPTSGLDFDAVDKVLRVRIPTDAFANRAGILSEVGRLVADEESRDEFATVVERIRRDPAHCRIVELMLEGWRLSSFDGSVVLVPPEGSERRLRPVARAHIQRLVDADMIRTPLEASRPGLRRNFSYEVGPLSGTAVRAQPRAVE
jgi:hypothetical protein